MFAILHQMKQAAALLQQEMAGNAERFGRLEAVAQELQGQAAHARANAESPLISLTQWRDNLERLLALETEVRELRATLDQAISGWFFVDPS